MFWTFETQTDLFLGGKAGIVTWRAPKFQTQMMVGANQAPWSFKPELYCKYIYMYRYNTECIYIVIMFKSCQHLENLLKTTISMSLSPPFSRQRCLDWRTMENPTPYLPMDQHVSDLKLLQAPGRQEVIVDVHPPTPWIRDSCGVFNWNNWNNCCCCCSCCCCCCCCVV